jgi:hypothetical protein
MIISNRINIIYLFLPEAKTVTASTMLIMPIKASNPVRRNSGTETGGGIGLTGTGSGKGLIEKEEFFGVGVSFISKSSELLFVSWHGA